MNSSEMLRRTMISRELPDYVGYVDGLVFVLQNVHPLLFIPTPPPVSKYPTPMTFTVYGRQTPICMQHINAVLLPLGLVALRSLYEFVGIKYSKKAGLDIEQPPRPESTRQDSLHVKPIFRKEPLTLELLSRIEFEIHPFRSKKIIGRINATQAIREALRCAVKRTIHFTRDWEADYTNPIMLYLAAVLIRSYIRVGVDQRGVQDGGARSNPWTFRLSDEYQAYYKNCERRTKTAIRRSFNENKTVVRVPVFFPPTAINNLGDIQARAIEVRSLA